MIQIPILLTNLNFDHPIVWNGQSLEMFNLSYKQIADRVGALRLNRADLYNRIARIKMDMGKIRRIDIFDLDGTIFRLEAALRQLIPTITFLYKDQDNLNERIKIYNNLVKTINSLYEKYKDAAKPLIASVEANRAKVVTLRKRVQLISVVVESMALQQMRMKEKMQRLDGRVIDINNLISQLFVDIIVLQQGNYELSGTVSEVENYRQVIEARLSKAISDLENLIARACDLNIAVMELVAELRFIDTRIASVKNNSVLLGNRLQELGTMLGQIDSTLSTLTDYYAVARTRLEAIENYLTSFIIGGDNIYLDFGTDYTIIHAVPPPMPPCLEPEPCTEQCATSNVDSNIKKTTTKKPQKINSLTGEDKSPFSIIEKEFSTLEDTLPANFAPVGNEEVAKVYRALPNGGSLIFEEASSVPIITNTKFYSETTFSICENILVESFTNNINLREEFRNLNSKTFEPDFAITNKNKTPILLNIFVRARVECFGQTDISLLMEGEEIRASGISIIEYDTQILELKRTKVCLVQNKNQSCSIIAKFALVMLGEMATTFMLKGLVMDIKEQGKVFVDAITILTPEIGCSTFEIFDSITEFGKIIPVSIESSQQCAISTGTDLGQLEETKLTPVSGRVSQIFTHYSNSLKTPVLGAFVVKAGPTQQSIEPGKILYVDCYRDDQSRLESKVEASNVRYNYVEQGIEDIILKEVVGFNNVVAIYEGNL